MKKGKLRVIFNQEESEILIEGDSEGLNYLANICVRIIGKNSPAGHFHLMEEMENLLPGSINTSIQYSEDL